MSNKIDLTNKKYRYTRVSSQSQQTNSSLESQKQELIWKGILESNVTISVGSVIWTLATFPIRSVYLRKGLKLLAQNEPILLQVYQQMKLLRGAWGYSPIILHKQLEPKKTFATGLDKRNHTNAVHTYSTVYKSRNIIS